MSVYDLSNGSNSHQEQRVEAEVNSGSEPYNVVNENADLIPFVGSKHQTLVERVLQYSPQKDWNEALTDWEFIAEWDAGEDIFPCLCTQGEADGEEIRYLSYIRNQRSDVVARIGSSCILKFMGDSQMGADLQTYKSQRKAIYVSEKARLAALEAGILCADEVAGLGLLGRRKKVEESEYMLLCTAKAKISMTKALISPIELIQAFIDFDGKYPYESLEQEGIESTFDTYNELYRQLSSKTLTYPLLRKALFILTMFHWAQGYERFTILPNEDRFSMAYSVEASVDLESHTEVEAVARTRQKNLAESLTSQHDARFETGAYRRILKRYPPICFIIRQLNSNRWNFDQFADKCFGLAKEEHDTPQLSLV